jgi:hypothetical protein
MQLVTHIIRVVSILVLFVLVLPLRAGDLDKKIEASLGTAGDWSWVTPENRSTVVETIKQWQTNGNRRVFRYGDQLDGALISLNDEDTVREYVNQYHAGNGQAESELMLYGREQVVIDLSSDLFLSNGTDRGGGDSYKPSIRDQSADFIARSITKSTSFPEATRDWAKANGYLPAAISSEKAIASWRAWWEHNKNAILSHRYENATWLPPEVEQSAPIISQSESNALKPLHEPDIPHIPQITSSSTVSVWLYGAVGLSIMLLAGVLLFLRGRK